MDAQDTYEINYNFYFCRTIGPKGLEKHLGEIIGKIYYVKWINGPIVENAVLTKTSDENYCSQSGERRSAKNIILHGDGIRIYCSESGKKFPWRDYIFVDDSD